MFDNPKSMTNHRRWHSAKFQAQCKEAISKSKIGEKNGMWKGEKVSYRTLHQYIRRHFATPKLCQNCNRKKPLEIANISGKYYRKIEDYKWVCRRCHMVEDGRFERLHPGD